MNSKHIEIKQPQNSVSYYYNLNVTSLILTSWFTFGPEYSRMAKEKFVEDRR